MINDNYPPGAATDPRAPYNQKNTPEFEPMSCAHCGAERVLNSDLICENCFNEELDRATDRDYDREAKEERLNDELGD
jgi:hypothetical protein